MRARILECFRGVDPSLCCDDFNSGTSFACFECFSIRIKLRYGTFYYVNYNGKSWSHRSPMSLHWTHCDRTYGCNYICLTIAVFIYNVFKGRMFNYRVSIYHGTILYKTMSCFVWRFDVWWVGLRNQQWALSRDSHYRYYDKSKRHLLKRDIIVNYHWYRFVTVEFNIYFEWCNN